MFYYVLIGLLRCFITGNLLRKHGLQHQIYVDDTQLSIAFSLLDNYDSYKV